MTIEYAGYLAEGTVEDFGAGTLEHHGTPCVETSLGLEVTRVVRTNPDGSQNDVDWDEVPADIQRAIEERAVEAHETKGDDW